MAPFTEEQIEQLLTFSQSDWRPRGTGQLSKKAFREIKANALAGCFMPPDQRPQCTCRKLTDPPPAALASRLRENDMKFDPIRYLWHSQLKQCYRKFLQRQREAAETVQLALLCYEISSRSTPRFRATGALR